MMTGFRYSETNTAGNGRLPAPKFMCPLTNYMEYARYLDTAVVVVACGSIALG